MTRRNPRLEHANRPILVSQRAVGGTTVFPTVDHYFRFLRRLEQIKRRFGCAVLGYAILPKSVRLILLPCNHDVTKAAHSLFISAAKTLRCNDSREKGCVFGGRFESNILNDKSAVREAMDLLAEETRTATSSMSFKWPFACPDGRNDRFRICRQAAARYDQREFPGNYLFSHGRPTLRWYGEALGTCCDLIEAALKTLI